MELDSYEVICYGIVALTALGGWESVTPLRSIRGLREAEASVSLGLLLRFLPRRSCVKNHLTACQALQLAY